MQAHSVVGRDQWLEARKALLAEEKAFIRERDRLAAARRALPWERVEKAYAFETETGRKTLADLFEGRSQLIVYHFMFGADWEQGCPSCSFLAENFDGSAVHLSHRDVAFVAASRAPLDRLLAYRKRLGWRFPWVSSLGSDFNYDFHVSFTPEQMAAGTVDYNYREGQFPSEEAPGLSVFARGDDGAIFHTYSTFARGLDPLISTYQYLDLVPKGRDEATLPWPMAWVRRNDQYDD
ncbi:MAG: thioredoxin family protein [Alphaproteobacteria bacterium]